MEDRLIFSQAPVALTLSRVTIIIVFDGPSLLIDSDENAESWKGELLFGMLGNLISFS